MRPHDIYEGKRHLWAGHINEGKRNLWRAPALDGAKISIKINNLPIDGVALRATSKTQQNQ
jgi:hypothetical protein